MNIQEIIRALDRFWSKQDCVLLPACGERGADVLSPESFFGLLAPRPLRVARVEPARRAADMGGALPALASRCLLYHVCLKPAPGTARKLLIRSLDRLGIAEPGHDIRWVGGEWESEVLDASAAGWRLRIDGLRVCRFLYVRRLGGVVLPKAPVMIAYGLERLAMQLQRKRSLLEVDYDGKAAVGELFLERERQVCRHDAEESDVRSLSAELAECAKEGPRLAGKGLHLIAYEKLTRGARLLELLRLRGALSTDERRVRLAELRALGAALAGRNA